MKIYQKSMFALLLSMIFVLPAFSQETVEKTAKVKIIKEENGKRTVIDTVLNVKDIKDIEEIESLHDLLGDDALMDIDIDMDDLENNIKVMVKKHDGDSDDSDHTVFIFKDGDSEDMAEQIEIMMNGKEVDMDSLQDHMSKMEKMMTYKYEVESDEDSDGTTKEIIIMSSDGDKDGQHMMFFSDDDLKGDEQSIDITVEETDDGKKMIVKNSDGTKKEYTIEKGKGAYLIDDEGNMTSINNDSDVDWQDKSEGSKTQHIIVDMDDEGDGQKVIVKKTISIDTDAAGESQKTIIWKDEESEKSEGEHEVIVTVIKSDDPDMKTVEHRIWIGTPEAEDYALMGKAGVKAAPSEDQKLNIERLAINPAEDESTYKVSFNADKGNKTDIYFIDDSGKVFFKEKLDDFSGNYKKELNLKDNLGKSFYLLIAQNKKFKAYKIRVK